MTCFGPELESIRVSEIVKLPALTPRLSSYWLASRIIAVSRPGGSLANANGLLAAPSRTATSSPWRSFAENASRVFLASYLRR